MEEILAFHKERSGAALELVANSSRESSSYSISLVSSCANDRIVAIKAHAAAQAIENLFVVNNVVDHDRNRRDVAFAMKIDGQ